MAVPPPNVPVDMSLQGEDGIRTGENVGSDAEADADLITNPETPAKSNQPIGVEKPP